MTRLPTLPVLAAHGRLPASRAFELALRAFAPAARGLALAALFLAPSAAADVLTVDDDGLADHTSVQAAIDASSAGDVILLAPGAYDGFVLDGKPLTIAAAHAGSMDRPLLRTACVVRNIPAGRTLLLADLLVGTLPLVPQPPPAADGLRIESCAGSVRLQNLGLAAFDQPDGATGNSFAALRVLHAPDVTASLCTLVGAAGAPGVPGTAAADGGTGLHVEDASVTAWQCQVSGGLGGGAVLSPDPAGDGGLGAAVLGGTAIFEGCTVEGGPGGDSSASASTGGIGLLIDATSTTWLRATAPAGGPGGVMFDPLDPVYGPPGADTSLAGAVLLLGGIVTPLYANPVVAEPGDIVMLTGVGSGLLLLGAQGAALPLPGWFAPLHLLISDVVALPGFPLAVSVPPVPPTFPETVVHLQLATPGHELSAPALLVVVPAHP
jgi:hypothetical protein